MTASLEELAELTAHVISAYVSNHNIGVEELPALIVEVHGALGRAANDTGIAEPVPEPLKPAVPIKKSVDPDFIICLEDGKKYKSLKRHLRNAYGMTPQEYREKWDLPPDYPMVAPNYAQVRSELAKRAGLGQHRFRAPAE